MITIVCGHMQIADTFNSDILYKTVTFTSFLKNGNFGTCVFGLLAGYFLSSSRFSVKKLLKITGQVFFYAVVLTIFIKLINPTAVDTKTLIKSFFPISSYLYWFASCYVLVYAISPFIKISLNYFHKDYKKYDLFFIFIFLITVGLSFVTPYNLALGETCWILFLFYAGDYIRCLDQRYNFSKKNCLIVLIVAHILLVVYSLIINYLGSISSIFQTMSDHLVNRYGLLTFVISAAWVILMSKFEIKYKAINLVSSVTFGIYLIHTHSPFNQYLWNLLNNLFIALNVSSKSIYLILCMVLIFVVCGLIEYLRQKTIEKFYLKLIDKPCKRMDAKIYSILD